MDINNWTGPKIVQHYEEHPEDLPMFVIVVDEDDLLGYWSDLADFEFYEVTEEND